MVTEMLVLKPAAVFILQFPEMGVEKGEDAVASIVEDEDEEEDVLLIEDRG